MEGVPGGLDWAIKWTLQSLDHWKGPWPSLSPHKQLYLGYLKSLGPAVLFEFFHALHMDSQDVFRDHICFWSYRLSPLLIRLVKAMVFPVVTYGCETWTIKKAECRKIDAFELWCWRLLRVPWTARRSNQSILKKISPEYSLEGLMLKLKFQYFGHLMQRADSFEDWCWEGLRAGGEGDDRGWDGWMASSTWWTWVWVGSWSCWWTGRPGVLQLMGSQRVRHDWATELNWTESTGEDICHKCDKSRCLYI